MSEKKIKLVSIFSYSVILLCILVIMGWQWDIPVLRSIIPGIPETTPLTAILILMLAVALALSGESTKDLIKPAYFIVYRSLIAIVIFAAAFTGFQYVFNLPPSIETIFYPEIVKLQSAAFPGRPSDRTVLTFLFIGTAMFFAHSKKRLLQNIAMVSSMLGLVIPWIALFGYSTSTEELYLIPDFPKTGMSPITALAFIVLDFGVMSLWPDRGILGLLRASTSGATMAKIFLPIVTLVPLALSWVVLFFVNSGHLAPTFSFVIEWGFSTIFLAGAIIWGGTIIHKRDLEKEKLHGALKQAEEQFRTLVESAPDAMIIVNNKGMITLVNNQAEKMFGYTKEEILGKEIEQLIPLEFLSSHKKLREDFFRSPRTRMMGEGKILKGRKKNGEEIPVEIALSPIHIRSELMISAIVRDISERIKAEDEIRISLRNLNYVNQVARIGHYQTDSSLNDFKLSENFCNLFGSKERFITREKLRGMLHPDDLKKYRGRLDEALKKEENYEIEFRMINPLTNETFHVRNFNYFLHDSFGNVQVIGLMQDVTRQKQIQEEITELNKNLEQKVKERTTELRKAHDELEFKVEERTEQLRLANKELEAFSYSVSHDLRAPLRAITGFSAILKNDYDELLGDEGKRIISIIVNNTTRMGQLIDDILVFSRLSRSEIANTELNMKTIFRDVYLRLLEEKENKGRKIEFTVEDIPNTKGDRAMITQVVTNLVSNALKYTGTRENAIIRVGYETKNNKNVYYIKDNGVGFDERHKSKLFQVFQRLHNDRDFTGTGIGLAIVHRIVSKHGGEVWAESVLNESAAFFFTLP